MKANQSRLEGSLQEMNGKLEKLERAFYTSQCVSEKMETFIENVRNLELTVQNRKEKND